MSSATGALRGCPGQRGLSFLSSPVLGERRLRCSAWESGQA